VSGGTTDNLFTVNQLVTGAGVYQTEDGVTRKFSGITPGTAAPSDQLIGLKGGTTDELFTISQVLGSAALRTVLTSNANYYVSSTGSDSNPGTIGSPWATLQHAMFFIAANIDFAGFQLTVNIGAGTFAGMGFATCVGGGLLMFKGAGPALTTITAGPNDGTFNFGECFTFNQNGYFNTQADIAELTCSNAGTGIGIFVPSILFCGFDGPNGVTLAAREGFGVFTSCIVFLGTITVPATNPHGNFNIIFFITIYGYFQAYNPVTFVGNPTIATVLQCEEYSFFQDFGVTFSGAITFTAAPIIMEWFSNSNLASNHYPNTWGYFISGTSTFGPDLFYSQNPTIVAGAIPGQWGMKKDNAQTAGFGNYVTFNDAATICYMGKIGKYTVATLPAGLTAGTEAWVTDALAPAFGGVVAGGGGVFSPVYFDGAAWRSG
jgi:hypothetical protein